MSKDKLQVKYLFKEGTIAKGKEFYFSFEYALANSRRFSLLGFYF
jgi:hypothetical protein